MRTTVWMAVIGIMAAGVAEARNEPAIGVTVEMRGGPERTSPALQQARAMAARMFAAAGIRLEWCDRASHCRDWEDRIVITLRPTAPAALPQAAMAEAFSFEGRNIRIYLDRMPATDGGASLTPAFWAHVLVHELTHMLQNSDVHAEHGVMKARWDRHDLSAIRHQPLPFTATDIKLIHDGLARRRGYGSGGAAGFDPSNMASSPR